MKKHFTVSTLAGAAALVALNIVITRFLSVTVGPVRIGFGFLPIAFGSMLYGPVVGTISALVADVLGAVIQGAGFGLSAALYGLTYGLFLYGRKKSCKNIAACVILQAIVIDAFLGALWYYIYTSMTFPVALTGRSINALVMIPVKIVMIQYLIIFRKVMRIRMYGIIVRSSIHGKT